MLFIHSMWDHEGERIGMQRCTRLGYTIHAIGELIGYLGLVLLLATLGILVRAWLAGTFHAAMLWWCAAPFGVGLVSEVMVQCSWRMALKRGFRWDNDQVEARWVDAGEPRTYRYESPQ